MSNFVSSLIIIDRYGLKLSKIKNLGTISAYKNSLATKICIKSKSMGTIGIKFSKL